MKADGSKLRLAFSSVRLGLDRDKAKLGLQVFGGSEVVVLAGSIDAFADMEVGSFFLGVDSRIDAAVTAGIKGSFSLSAIHTRFGRQPDGRGLETKLITETASVFLPALGGFVPLHCQRPGDLHARRARLADERSTVDRSI